MLILEILRQQTVDDLLQLYRVLRILDKNGLKKSVRKGHMSCSEILEAANRKRVGDLSVDKIALYYLAVEPHLHMIWTKLGYGIYSLKDISSMAESILKILRC